MEKSSTKVNAKTEMTMTSHKPIEKGETWKVLAETSGDGIGVRRNGKIDVLAAGATLKLSARTRHDWENDPELSPLDPPVPEGQGLFDPTWYWEGAKALERADGEKHTIKVGFVKDDPDVCVIFVNEHGTATIER